MPFSLYDATPKDSPRLFIGIVAGALTAMALMLVAVESVPEKKPEKTGPQADTTPAPSSTTPAALTSAGR
jgi:hypothetical protein